MLNGIVDSHIHFWDLARLHYPWLDGDGVDALRVDYLPTDWVCDARGVEVVATVHVQAEVDHAVDPVLETAWLDELATGHAVPTAVVGYADLRSAALADVLDRHLEFSFFRGIRQEAWFDPLSRRADVPTENFLEDAAWRAGLSALRERDLSFDLLVWSRQLPMAVDVFRAVPGLRVVLEHTGLPIEQHERAQWRRDVARFAREVPGSVLKISGLGMVDRAWTPSRVDPVIREAIQLFGPERCMFASNYPVERPGMNYAGIWATFDRCTADLSDAERDAIFRTTALRTYRLSP
ncbi:MAG: amidohydrolase family protein [Salinibacterium sp.]|nr:amidohydrolase family protein [Salinibacterium sp.]